MKLSVHEVSKNNIRVTPQKDVEFLSADSLHFPLFIRKWRQGDTFFPFGLSKLKKISEFLTDLKLSSEEKANQLLLLNKSEIVWVIKRRLDNRYAVSTNTKKIMKVRCK